MKSISPQRRAHEEMAEAFDVMIGSIVEIVIAEPDHKQAAGWERVFNDMDVAIEAGSNVAHYRRAKRIFESVAKEAKYFA